MFNQLNMSEKFCLKWNDFQSNIAKSFSGLRGETQLFDVTLVGQDQKKLSAHRLVLSACSDFFKNIFYSNTHSHPMLYLDGVDSKEINLMLDYIYMGEVKIFQDHLDKFLQIANKFQLEGLLGGEDNKDENNMNIDQSNSEPSIRNKNDSYPNNSPFVNILVKTRHVKKEKLEQSLKVCDETFDASNSEVDEKFQELIVREGNVLRCTMCERTMTHKGSMKRHLETHLTGLNYSCHLCDETFRSSMSLSNHKRMHRYHAHTTL